MINIKNFFNKISFIHPILFSIFPILFLYDNNLNQFNIDVIIIPILISITITIIGILLLSKIFKNKLKGYLAISFFWVWFYSYSHFKNFLFYNIATIAIFRHRYFILIWIILFVVSIMYIVRQKSDLLRSNRFFSVVSIFLILFQFVMFGYHYIPLNLVNVNNTKENEKILNTGNVKINSKNYPDIYYVLLDAYTGQKELLNVLNYDNSKFLDSLESKGFYVPSDSHSNYSWTSLSLPSTLNMEYFDTEKKFTGNDYLLTNNFDLTHRIRIWKQNTVTKILETFGYQYVNLSLFPEKSNNSTDSFSQSIDFFAGLLDLSFLQKLIVENVIYANAYRQEIFDKFSKLNDIHPGGPKFVYAHFILPHPPYKFDSTGRKPQFYKIMNMDHYEKELCINQTIYCNKLTLKFLNNVLSKDPGAVIIIQGDHGAWQLGRNSYENIRLRMNILNAYYVPKDLKSKLYNTITPVNSFRLLFNYLFDLKMPLLKDKSYYSENDETLQLKNVTDMLK